MLDNAYFDFTIGTLYCNSNGTDFTTEKGIYRFSSMFSGHDGERSRPLITPAMLPKNWIGALAYGSLDTFCSSPVNRLPLQTLSGKFVGDVIITPDCLSDFLSYVFGITIYDGALISGTSVYKDKLGQQVADPRLVIHSRPVSPEIVDGYFITGDGYQAENCTIIDHGILKTFLLTLYGANKTGLKRAVNNGGCYVVEPGEKSLDEIVSQIDRGIMVARYSGGYPSQNGDFSGVAKNSYYIENGKIQYPISETMISGNLINMLKNIIDISRERVDFGSGIYPWIAFSGVTISGR